MIISVKGLLTHDNEGRYNQQSARFMSVDNPLISVIVPVYNVEKYLDKCIASIANQTYKNLEVILIDDGSKDNCGKICDEWAKKDSRVKVIHKENGGMSSARNAGLDIMHGELIGFIDSDDYIVPEMYEKLYYIMKQYDTDISACLYMEVDENGNALPEQWLPETKNLLSGLEALRDTNLVGVIVWNKLYKREIFDTLRFKENLMHEDTLINHHVLGQCKRIAFINECLYFYLHRDTSTIGELRSVIFHRKSFKDISYTMQDRYEYLLQLGETKAVNIVILNMYGRLIHNLQKVNYLQFRHEISPALRYTVKRLIMSGKFTYWLRIIKLALVLLRSIFRPYLSEEQIK